MKEEEALAAIREQVADLARTDQERAHVAHDASLLVHYWQTLRDGGLPEDLVDDLTRAWHDYVLGYHANKYEEDDE